MFVLVKKQDLVPSCFGYNFHMFVSMLPYVLLATCLIAVSLCEISLKMQRYSVIRTTTNPTVPFAGGLLHRCKTGGSFLYSCNKCSPHLHPKQKKRGTRTGLFEGAPQYLSGKTASHHSCRNHRELRREGRGEPMAAAKRMQMYCYLLKICYTKNEKILVIARVSLENPYF